jgi:hypothetical protein
LGNEPIAHSDAAAGGCHMQWLRWRLQQTGVADIHHAGGP